MHNVGFNKKIWITDANPKTPRFGVNMLTFWEVIALAKKSNQHIAYLMLDFEKAYDRVQWPYLENVMEGLGLPSKWRSVALALYKVSLSRVLVLGH